MFEQNNFTYCICIFTTLQGQKIKDNWTLNEWPLFYQSENVLEPNKNMQEEQLLDPPIQYLTDVFALYFAVFNKLVTCL